AAPCSASLVLLPPRPMLTGLPLPLSFHVVHPPMTCNLLSLDLLSPTVRRLLCQLVAMSRTHLPARASPAAGWTAEVVLPTPHFRFASAIFLMPSTILVGLPQHIGHCLYV